MDPNSDDAAIAEFHAAARRRRRRIMGITSVLCLVIGAAILIMTFMAGQGSDEGGGRFEAKTLAIGIGFVLASFGAGAAALKGE